MLAATKKTTLSLLERGQSARSAQPLAGAVLHHHRPEGCGCALATQSGVRITVFDIILRVLEHIHHAAQYNLGAMYRHGQGVPRDLKESLKWYRLAGDQGDEQARQILPSLYKESLEWLRIEAEHGSALAQSGLGVIYAQGLGVPDDIKEAVKWWRLAANQGDTEAQASLGFLSESGTGVPQDYVQAFLWYSLIAADYPGNMNAVAGLQAVTKRMTPAQISEAQALVRNWKPK